MLDTGKPIFKLATDSNGQAIPAFNLKPDCIKSLADGAVVSCVNKTIVVFENDVQIQINGAGYLYTLPANKEVCITDIDSLTVTGLGKYMIV